MFALLLISYPEPKKGNAVAPDCLPVVEIDPLFDGGIWLADF